MTSTDLIATARKYLYVRETAPNSGPHIDEWLAAVGCKSGDSWCAAYACAMVRETNPRFKFHPSASALHLLANNPNLITFDPRPGDLVVYDHGHGVGHVAILTATTTVDGRLAYATTIAGNTSADGKSRNGDRVAEHDADLERVAGVIRVTA